MPTRKPPKGSVYDKALKRQRKANRKTTKSKPTKLKATLKNLRKKR